VVKNDVQEKRSVASEIRDIGFFIRDRRGKLVMLVGAMMRGGGVDSSKDAMAAISPDTKQNN
jgi:hypothetical protein